jgi:hypothetical protein
MGREVTSVASFRTSLPSHGRTQRRGCGRRLPVLVLLIALVCAVVSLVRRSKANTRLDEANSQNDVQLADKAMLDLIVRTKEAIQAETPMEDIAAYADRTRVLYVRFLLPSFHVCAERVARNAAELTPRTGCRNSTCSARRSTRRIPI